MYPVIAVLAAVAAAVAFGASGVFEQRSARQVPERGALSPRLLFDLSRLGLWRAGILLTVLGIALQVLALHFGPLALVQPVLICDLLFAVLISNLLGHRAPDPVMLLGVGCCVAGLVAFLVVARPGGGKETVSFTSALPLAIVLAALMAACLVLARVGPRSWRPLELALACGIAYGVTACLYKLLSFSLSEGFSAPLRQWPLYAIVIIGPLGFLLNQSAFQAGLLIALVLAVITITDPLVSVLIAHFWLAESIANSPAELAGEVVALAVVAVGVYALAHRAPHVAQALRKTADRHARL